MRWFCCLVFLITVHVSSINGYVSKCVKSGVKCADCEHMIHCVATPKGLIHHQLNYCNNSQTEYCSAKDGGCSPDPSSCKIFGLKELPCQNSSSFPDPYDCNSYHQCIQQADGSFASIKYVCSEDRAYDSLSGTCRFKPNHRVCKESPVPKCLYPIQSGTLKENPAIYYVCIKTETDLVPFLYKCRTGEEYKPVAHACVETLDSKIFSCVGEGTFVDPSDSNKYYKCHKDTTFTHKSCPKGQYFNIGEATCRELSTLLNRKKKKII